VTPTQFADHAAGAERAGVLKPGLSTHGLSVAYGGHRAVKDVSISAPPGRITGLIGPNGAGKTTTFNACNGLLKPSAGSVSLFGTDVTRRSPASRAQMGLGRTFQRMEIVNTMDVATNVAIGREARVAGMRPFKQLRAGRVDARQVRAAARDAMATCGLLQIAERKAGALSTGQRRLLELARALAGGFSMLLLDEPSSGLDESETERFGEVLTGVVADRGVGILLVEHDMALVMSVCEYLHVLDFGNLIFEGTPAETRNSSLVRDAYLGKDAGELAELAKGAPDEA
jgi:ABC-type branched-subunit amino acid transport system ATPase component